MGRLVFFKNLQVKSSKHKITLVQTLIQGGKNHEKKQDNTSFTIITIRLICDSSNDDTAEDSAKEDVTPELSFSANPPELSSDQESLVTIAGNING